MIYRRGIICLLGLIVPLFVFCQKKQQLQLHYLKTDDSKQQSVEVVSSFPLKGKSIQKTQNGLVFNLNDLHRDQHAEKSKKYENTIDFVLKLMLENTLLTNGFEKLGFTGGDVFSEEDYSVQVWNASSEPQLYSFIKLYAQNYQAAKAEFYGANGELALQMHFKDYQSQGLYLLPKEIELRYFEKSQEVKKEWIRALVLEHD